MTWLAMTKAASGVACAVPAECTCRSAAAALHAAVRSCVASAQADEQPVTANKARRPSALWLTPRECPAGREPTFIERPNTYRRALLRPRRWQLPHWDSAL